MVPAVYRLLNAARWPDSTACEFLPNDSAPSGYCFLTPAGWPEPTASEFLLDGGPSSRSPFANTSPMA
jgi:hypothetical protein